MNTTLIQRKNDLYAGRTVDFHILRTTFATRLIKQDVQPSNLQRLMRHADIKTTNDYYTDLRLHNLDGAVNQLSMPELVPKKQEQEYLATGTDDCSGNCPKTMHEMVQNGASLVPNGDRTQLIPSAYRRGVVFIENVWCFNLMHNAQ